MRFLAQKKLVIRYNYCLPNKREEVFPMAWTIERDTVDWRTATGTKKISFFDEQNWKAANGVKTIWERLQLCFHMLWLTQNKIFRNHEQPATYIRSLVCTMLRAALQQGSAIFIIIIFWTGEPRTKFSAKQPTFGLRCTMLRAALQQGSAIISPGQNGWVIYKRMDRRWLCKT